MSNTFLANPDILRQEGNSLADQGQQFGQNIEKIYSTLEELLANSYVSPAAKAIGESIKTRRDDLEMMKKIIADYSNYCLTTSGTVVKNEENIIDNYANRG